MQIERLPPIVATLKASNHPYLSGPWTPQHEEVNATDLEVIEGAISTDIDGVYLRNTENQIHTPLGRCHPFDGDGMLHQISFCNDYSWRDNLGRPAFPRLPSVCG